MMIHKYDDDRNYLTIQEIQPLVIDAVYEDEELKSDAVMFKDQWTPIFGTNLMLMILRTGNSH